MTATVTILEDSPLFNAGKGAVLNAEGYCEMDASIMDGSTQAAGAVAGVQQAWQLPAAYALAAFGMGFVFPSFQALAADAVEAHEQGAAAGTVAAAQGLRAQPHPPAYVISEIEVTDA